MKQLLSLLAVSLLSLTACAQKAPKVIQLLEPSYDEGLTLMQALKERKSSSGFTEKEIPLQDLSNILWAAVGVNRPDGKRTAPTGSNRQEIEVYAFFKTGAYYYNYKDHTLELVKEGDYRSLTGRRGADEAYLNLLFFADTDNLVTEFAGYGNVVGSDDISSARNLLESSVIGI